VMPERVVRVLVPPFEKESRGLQLVGEAEP